MAKYLCKKCDKCIVYRYKREFKGKPFKFLYCEQNKDLVEQYNWFPETHLQGRTTYVRCTDPKRFGFNRLHTYYAEEGYIVDHINHKGQDNRLFNLRLLTKRENSLNRSDNTKYPGVFKEGNEYIARIKINGKYHRVKKHPDPEVCYAHYLKAKQIFSGE